MTAMRYRPVCRRLWMMIAVATACATLATTSLAQKAKISVQTRDIFAVSYADIAAALNLTVDEVSAQVGAAALAMRCGDEPVSYLPDPANQRILFYGWPAENFYTRINYFWIEPGVGRHIVRQSPDSVEVSPDQTFDSVRENEVDFYALVNHAEMTSDFFYWNGVEARNVSGTISAIPQVFTVALGGYAEGDAEISLRLIGLTTTSPYRHHIEVDFAGAGTLGSIEFSGKQEVQLEFVVPAAALSPAQSDYSMTVRALLNPPLTVSKVGIDGFDVRYRRYYAPDADALIATAGDNSRLTARRFSDPVVWDITNPWAPVWIALEDGTLPSDHSWPAAAGGRWVFRERNALPAAGPRAAAGGLWMQSTTNRVDYLVIAPRVFQAQAETLANSRAGLGLRTAVAYYEDILDRFANGMATPESIQWFLRYAQQYWDSPPWMVALLGDGHSDFYNARTSAPNFLPPLLLFFPGYGWFGCDGPYADTIGDDGVPDIAVGRIPIRSSEDFDAYYAKLAAYESAGPPAWENRAVFISDLKDGALDFKATNQRLGAIADDRYTDLIQHHFDDLDLATIRQRTQQVFTQGASLINYAGHGATLSIGGGANVIMSVNDINNLTNQPMPIFMALTCSVGRFCYWSATSTTPPAFGEAMVLREGGGALAVFAPATISFNDVMEAFGEEFYRTHVVDGLTTLGPALVLARRRFGVTYSSFLRPYNLLGDPAIKLWGGVAGSVSPVGSRSFAQWRFERFSLRDLRDPDKSGSQADPAASGWTNLQQYAFGGDSPGLTPLPPEEGGRARVEWMQRRDATDIEYRLWITTDLRQPWSPAPPETEIVAEAAADPSFERVRAHVPFTGGRLFMKVEVLER